ncbi:MP domain-containing protein [Senna tora]|uniref:MP domain-containing protein n=1 Tax=Senna tora TaxID=362788 RepID=A0A834XGF7_9FABA|nr:MP domain-containing protein [Senna tora]
MQCVLPQPAGSCPSTTCAFFLNQQLSSRPLLTSETSRSRAVWVILPDGYCSGLGWVLGSSSSSANPSMAASISVSESMRSVLNDSPSDVGKEEYRITHLAEDSDKECDYIPTDQIYKETLLSRVNFLNNTYKIKTLRKTISLQNKQTDVYLLTRASVRRHMSKYDFLHIGLVQAHVTPYHRNGLDIRILVCLRDTKYPNLEDSVLAAFEISLYGGAKWFNWFPNFSSSLSDLANSNGLVITMEPQGYNLAEGCENSHMFGISYRMCYKLMKGSPEPKSLFENPVLEVNTERTRVLVPKPELNPIDS